MTHRDCSSSWNQLLHKIDAGSELKWLLLASFEAILTFLQRGLATKLLFYSIQIFFVNNCHQTFVTYFCTPRIPLKVERLCLDAIGA